MAGKNIQGKVSSVIRGISGPVLGHYAKLNVVDIFSIFNQWLAMYVTRFSSVLYKYLTLQNHYVCSLFVYLFKIEGLVYKGSTKVSSYLFLFL